MLNEEKSSSAGSEENLPNQPTSQNDLAFQGQALEPQNENKNPLKKSRHLIRAFLFGFLFVVILAVICGAYFLGTQKSNNNQTPASSPAPTKEATDPTADWHNYAGNGFSFKYPAFLYLFDCSSTLTPKGIFVHLVTDETIDCNQPLSSSQNLINVTELNNFNEAQNIGKLNERDEETVDIDGKTYTLITGSREILGPEGEKISSSPIDEITYVLVPYKNTNLLIGYHRTLQVSNTNTRFAVQDDLSEDFKQILSTFKFTDASEAINETASPTPNIFANSKQYSDSKYSFNFKYPYDWTTQVKDDPGERIINIIKNSSPSVVSLSFSISDNWDNKGYSNQAKTITIGDGISAKQDDPPKKSEQKMERYQTNYFFEKNGNVYFFACTHNWNQDYINTCNKILSSVEFSN